MIVALMAAERTFSPRRLEFSQHEATATPQVQATARRQLCQRAYAGGSLRKGSDDPRQDPSMIDMLH